MGDETMRVCVAVVSNKGFVNLYSAVSWGSIMYMASANKIPCREIRVYDQHPISNARNTAVEDFLSEPRNTHLFFLDDDVVAPVDVVPRLIKHDKLVVSGWYLLRGNKQPCPATRTKHGWTQHTQEQLSQPQLLQVDGTGAGCLLIKREVFDVITKPYFLEGDLKTYKGCGEDLHFCLNLKQHNIPTYTDTTIYCRHFHFGLL